MSLFTSSRIVLSSPATSESAMPDWYIEANGENSGPFTDDELVYLRDRGRLTRRDKVRRGQQGQWMQAAKLTRLFPGGSTGGVTTETRRPAPVVSNAPARSAPAAPDPPAASPHEAPSAPPPQAPAPPPLRNDDGRRKILIAIVILLVVLLLAALIWLLTLLLPRLSGGGGGGSGNGGSGGGESSQGTPDGGETGTLDSESETGEEGSSTARPAPAPVPDAPSSRLVASDLAELNRRLQREGAQAGDVQISLMWSNVNDLDLHVITPSGEKIKFSHKRSRCGGELDVDMNAGNPTTQPVENVYWPLNGGPRGEFKVFVNHYSNRGAANPSPFMIVVTVDGRTRTYRGSVATRQTIPVCTFSR